MNASDTTMRAGDAPQSGRVDAVETSVALAAKLRARASAAEAKRDADSLEAGRLEESAGAALLEDDDPDASDRLAARLATLRASVDMQGKLAAEATSRARAAEADALRAEAELLAPAIVDARDSLAAFDRKTDRLREALAKHTGGKVRVVMPDEEALDAIQRGSSATFAYETPPRWRLGDALLRLEVRRDLARGLAEVVEGSRTLSDLRQQWLDHTDHRISNINKADHLPALVRDGVVVVPGLEFWLPIPVEAPERVSVN